MRKYKSAAATTVAKRTPTSACAATLGAGSEYLAAKKPKKKAAPTVKKMLKTMIKAEEVVFTALEYSEAKSAEVDKVLEERSDTFLESGKGFEGVVEARFGQPSKPFLHWGGCSSQYSCYCCYIVVVVAFVKVVLIVLLRLS